MADRSCMTVKLRFPWWWRLYLGGCYLFAFVTGLEPDVEKIARFIVRHSEIRHG